MQIVGIDFTSRPSPRKPITAAFGNWQDDRLSFDRLEEWPSFDAFEHFLDRNEAFVTGCDFPFTLPRPFIDNTGLPNSWPELMAAIGAMTRDDFTVFLQDYKENRQPGDKEHHRTCDRLHGAASPQKLVNPPVALMLYEGATRLRQSNVHIPGLRETGAAMICIEAYPGALARRLIGKTPYKRQEKDRRQASKQARLDILQALPNWCDKPVHLADDRHGDQLDAWLCAIIAAIAWQQDFAIPDTADPLEGWIFTGLSGS